MLCLKYFVNRDDGQCHDDSDYNQKSLDVLLYHFVALYPPQAIYLEERAKVFFVTMMVMMMVMMMVFLNHNSYKVSWFYFKMLYSSDVSDIRILVAENQSVVEAPMLEFCALTLLGST